jgi:hypothetical protein
MSYENATSTKMLATHCVVCARPLRDAISAELGIGPICRERHGWNAEIDAVSAAGPASPHTIRAEANRLIHQIAANLHDELVRATGCQALRELGFRKVAERIEYRGKDAPAKEPVEVRPSTRGTGCYVRAPYRPVAVAGWREVPGRRWDDRTNENFVPTHSRTQLWTLLRTLYQGHEVRVLDAHGNVSASRVIA